MIGLRTHVEHIILHLGMRVSHSGCPECRADDSRRFACSKPFRHLDAQGDTRHKYVEWVRPRIEAIRNGAIDAERAHGEYNALWWHRDFVRALHSRITSNMAGQGGRKHAPEYAKYHLATYGNDYRYLHG
jgi:hypothetical protein